MSKKKAAAGPENQTEHLLRYLVVLELYRFGLSKHAIRKRLGIGLNTVTDMLRDLKQPAGET
jgi:transposase